MGYFSSIVYDTIVPDGTVSITAESVVVYKVIATLASPAITTDNVIALQSADGTHTYMTITPCPFNAGDPSRIESPFLADRGLRVVGTGTDAALITMWIYTSQGGA